MSDTDQEAKPKQTQAQGGAPAVDASKPAPAPAASGGNKAMSPAQTAALSLSKNDKAPSLDPTKGAAAPTTAAPTTAAAPAGPTPQEIQATADKVGKAAAKGQVTTAEAPAINAAKKAFEDAVKAGKSAQDAEKLAEAAAKQAVKATVDGRMGELKAEGHGPDRHGPDITDQQLKDRAQHGKDPMTGTTTDGVTGGTHAYSATASKINTAEDYVKGEEVLRTSADFKTKQADAVKAGGDRFAVEMPLATVYGAEYKKKLSGATRTGSKKHPTGTTNADFTDGTLKAVFQKDKAGKWTLLTMYAEPK